MKVFFVLCLLFSVSFCGIEDEFEILAFNNDSQLPEITVTGTHRGVGYAIGQMFASRIQKFINVYPGLYEVLFPFYSTSHGAEFVSDLLNNNQDAYPQYFAELGGMAQGAQVSMAALVLLNFEDEINAYLANVTIGDNNGKTMKPSLHCTDVYLSTDSQSLNAHNEDASEFVKQYAFLAHVHIQDDDYDSEHHFSSYYYPGYLPGNSYAWNRHLTFTENAVFPDYLAWGGLGDNFVGRDALTARSLHEAVRLLTPYGRAYGISVNIGDLRSGTIINVETSYSNFSIYTIQGNYSHENMYKHLNQEQLSDTSSIHRQRRIDEFPVPKSAQDLLDILGDHKDAEYPIYRTPSTTDPYATCSTVLFDFVQQMAYIYVSNPSSSAPYLQFNLANSSLAEFW